MQVELQTQTTSTGGRDGATARLAAISSAQN
jgi:hypothetical protein